MARSAGDRERRGPGGPAAAAVDGSPVTAWTSGADPAVPTTLTVTLATTARLTRVDAVWRGARPLSAYTVEVPGPAGRWRVVATVPASASTVDRIALSPPVEASAVRLRLPATRSAATYPQLADLAVRPALAK